MSSLPEGGEQASSAPSLLLPGRRYRVGANGARVQFSEGVTVRYRPGRRIKWPKDAHLLDGALIPLQDDGEPLEKK